MKEVNLVHFQASPGEYKGYWEDPEWEKNFLELLDTKDEGRTIFRNFGNFFAIQQGVTPKKARILRIFLSLNQPLSILGLCIHPGVDMFDSISFVQQTDCIKCWLYRKSLLLVCSSSISNKDILARAEISESRIEHCASFCSIADTTSA